MKRALELFSLDLSGTRRISAGSALAARDLAAEEEERWASCLAGGGGGFGPGRSPWSSREEEGEGRDGTDR